MTSDVSVDAGRGMTAEIERLIGEEVDKLNPRPESRDTLVLIALGRVHPVAGQADTEARLRYLVFDEKGLPRTKIEDEREVDLTIADVVGELKQRYPKLFDDAPAIVPIPVTAERDWLTVATSVDQPTEKLAEPLLDPVEPEAKRHAELEEIISVAKAIGRSTVEASSAAARSFLETSASQPWWRRIPVLLVGALAVLLLLVLIVNPWKSPFDSGRAGATATQSTASRSAASPDVQEVSGVAEVIDTTTLKIDDKVLHLYGIEWARGGNADLLRNYLADRTVLCRASPPTDRHRCEVDGRDLSVVVLFNGGARTTSDAPPELRVAEQHARAEKKGVWRR